jgi:predicted DNA-binding transcriptional regulator AlpA
MGAGEIARRLGLSRQRVQQLAERDDWPEPYDELAMGRVWRISDIEAWIRRQRADQQPATPPPDP